MAANVFFDSPPVLLGDEKGQLLQLQRYLMSMSDKLNEALMDITIEQMAPETQKAITQNQENGAQKYETLKSMIIKTAEIVRTEMSEISTQLESRYEALSSQFGSYEQNLQNTITATAEGIMQQYDYEERISGLESDTDAFYRRINQYIFSGLVDSVNGKYGIAIGENVTAYDANGNPYLNNNRKMATFTMDRLSFWQGTVELAYFSNQVFHIAQGEVEQSLKLGNLKWMVLSDNSVGFISV